MEIIDDILYAVTDEDIIAGKFMINGKFVVPYDVIEIGDLAFNHCQTLKEVIASNVRKVGRNAFYHMPLLERVDISNAKEIANGGFTDCPKLKEVILPKIKHLGECMFSDCLSIPRPNKKIRKEIYDNTIIALNKGDGVVNSMRIANMNAIIKYKMPICIQTCYPSFTYKNALKFRPKQINYGDDFLSKKAINGLIKSSIKGEKACIRFLKWCYKQDNNNEQ